MAASFASINLKSTLFPVLPGTTIAGTGTPVSFAPDIAKAAVAVRPPLTAVTVTTRFDLSAPVEIVAATVPASLVFAPLTENTALLSTAKLTGTEATICPPSEVVVAVAVTFPAPVFRRFVSLSAITSFVAVSAPAPVVPPDVRGSKPDAPGEPPPPPHAATANVNNNEARVLNMFISKSIGLSAQAL